MRLIRVLSSTALVLGSLSCLPAYALETDQYTVPPGPLVDTGTQLSTYIANALQNLDENASPADELYRKIGTGLPASKIESALLKFASTEGPTQFRPGTLRSIYAWVLSPLPGSFTYLSPTLQVHGTYLGADKIGHLFQQGHEYYAIYRKQLAKGATSEAALQAAIASGVAQENGYFGKKLTGIYSNSDLAANFAGLKFYLNLTEPVRIYGREWPPILERQAGKWIFSPSLAPSQLLVRFISDHLNEAMNPSEFHINRGRVRGAIRKRCRAWKEFFADKVSLLAPSPESFARTWFGEEYGHRLPAAREISLATECSAP